MRELEARLRREADEEMKKAKTKARMEETWTSRDPNEVARAREVGAAKASNAMGLVQQEQQKQSESMEARLVARRRRLRAKEALVQQRHSEAEARVQLENERERLQAKPVSKVKNKKLFKELQKVN